MSQNALPEQEITISKSAVKRIVSLIESEGNAALKLRVSVSGGGCSGFQYGFELDEGTTDEDLIFELDGVQVVVDKVSLDLLNGAELDFKEDLMGSYFVMSNPNATSTCGCGSSFSV